MLSVIVTWPGKDSSENRASDKVCKGQQCDKFIFHGIVYYYILSYCYW